MICCDTGSGPGITPGYYGNDEANRALNKEKQSGFVAPAHLFLPSNIKFDGGDKNTYDPSNNYTDAYAKIWGK